MRPIAFIAVLLLLWQFAIARQANHLLPSPVQVATALWELLRSGVLLKYVVASLFRVTWGFLLAVALAIPLGLAAGWSRAGDMALNPLAQVFRPISPLAWIPLAILWFGVGDLSSLFLIFIGCFFPLLVATMTAVRSVPAIYVNAGRNFGLSSTELLRQVIFPAILPELIIALRVTLGVAWLVVVAAEMIAVNSGLGFLIVDARNAGNRYDLVVAGMVVIAIIGLSLNLSMRSLERVRSVRWGYFEDVRN
jgi:NitT/TauT family transport system permease protein